MNQKCHKYLEILVANFYQFLNDSYQIPKIIENILIIQYSLLEISFIFSKEHNSSYIKFFIILARPQTILKMNNLEYLIICWNIFYLIGPFSKFTHNKYVALYQVFLRSALFQFVIEQLSIQYLNILVYAILIIQKLIDQLIFESTYNVKTFNLQKTQINLIDIISTLFDIIILFFSVYEVQHQYIQLLCLIGSIIKTFNFLIYFQYNNYLINTSIFCIYVITIIKAFVNFLKIQNDIDILLLPLIVVVIAQYQNRRFKINPSNQNEILSIHENNKQNLIDNKIIKGHENTLIYASILINDGDMLEAYKILKKMIKLPLVIKVKKEALQKQCIQKIFQNIIIKNQNSQGYDKFVTAIQNMEHHFMEIQTNLIQILQKKIECLTKMHQFEMKDISFYIQCCSELLQIKNQLIQQYKACPTQKMQTILGFYYVELMNDFIATASLFQIDSLSDFQLNYFNIDQSIFNNKITFIISKLDDNLTIQKCSSNITDLFHRNESTFVNQSIEILIPSGVKQVHQKLVNQFIKGQNNKFYKNFEKNMILQSEQSEICNSIEMCVDLFITDDIYSISLFQPCHQDLYALVLNSSQQIISISEQFIEYFDLKSSYQNLLKKHIISLLPRFQIPNEQHQYYTNQEIMISFTNTSKRSPIPFNNDLRQITNYNVFYRKIENQLVYFIIEFEHFKKIAITSKSELDQSSDFDKNSIKNGTLDDQLKEGSIAQNPRQFQVNQINLEEFNKLRLLSQNQISEKIVNFYSSPVSATQTKQQLIITSREQSLIEGNDSDNAHENSSNVVEDMVIQQVHYSASQLSCVQGVHNSKYFKKYDLVHKINENSRKVHYHKHLLIFIIFFISIQIIFQSVSLNFFINDMKTLVNDIDLLQISNYIFAPLENQLMLKSQIGNYKLLFQQKIINQTYLQYLTQYPTINLNPRFNEMKQHADQIMGKYLLQEFLENTYIEVEQQISTNQSQIYNVTLRNSLGLLITFQFASNVQVITAKDPGLQTDKPYAFFTVKNLINIKHKFQELENKVYLRTLKTQQYITDQINLLIFFQIGVTIIQLIILIFYYRKIILKQKQYIKLFTFIQKSSLNQEIQKLQSILNNIQKNIEFVYQFQFSLDEQDIKIDSKQKQYKTERRQERDIPVKPLLNFMWIFQFSIIIILIFLNIILSHTLLNQYLTFYPKTIQLYHDISVLGVDLPSAYSRRENYQYRSIYPYFSLSDEKALVNDIFEILSRIKSFSQQQINLQEIQVSDIFRNKYTQIMESNLCDALPDSIKNTSETLCPKTLYGQMSNGVEAILISILNQFQNDYQINQFKYKLQSSILESEGIFMMNEILVNLNNEFKIEFLHITNELINNLMTYNIIIITLQFIFTILICHYIQVELRQRNQIIQSLPYLFPESVLLIDDGFERQLKKLFLDFI